ncbi:MAG TPA: DUF2066 domain-containing protein [Pseudomonadales bacterium]
MLALFPVPADAAERRPVELYTGEVPVSDQGEAERQRALPLALEQVMQKLTGLRRFDDNPLVHLSLERAPEILLSYYYRNVRYPLADGSQASELRLLARFSKPAVDEMARTLQLPLWQPDRKPVVMWLVVDTGVDRRIMPVEYAYLEHALSDIAQRRGLPLEWPEPGPEGEYAVDLSLLWGGYIEDLAVAAGEGVMIAAARREGLEWSVRLNLGFEGRHQAWRLRDIDLQAALAEGLEAAVDQVAALGTISASDIGSWSEDLVVSGLNGPDDYRRCLNYLQQISIVDDVAVLSARPGGVTFRLGLSALPDYLHRSLDSDGVLERSESGEAYELVRAVSHDG